MTGLALQLLLGFAIGASLGLLGGGGSLLTVPALVYVIGQTPQAAVATSLAIVAANSVMGASFHRARGGLNWRVALLFGGAGMLAAYGMAGWSQQVPPALLMVLFAALMLLIAGLMLFGRAAAVTPAARPWPVVAAAGVGVGALTGLLGVGGGFLVVPALVMLVGLPMPQAVGTSLAVIALNSLAGLLGHLGGAFDLRLIVTFGAAGLAGSFLGARLSGRLPADRLRQLFAVFVSVLALWLLVDNVPHV